MESPTILVRRAANRANGFTLIELMVVVVVIGILASMALPRFADVSRRAREAEAAPLMKQILTLQERHKAKEGAYTSELEALEGGTALASSGQYYTFTMSVSHSTGLCIQAAPNAAGTTAGLNALSMDATAATYPTGNCP